MSNQKRIASLSIKFNKKRYQLARCLYELAVRLVKQDEFDEAEKLLKEALGVLEGDDQHLWQNIEKVLSEMAYMRNPFRGIFDYCSKKDLTLEF